MLGGVLPALEAAEAAAMRERDEQRASEGTTLTEGAPLPEAESDVDDEAGGAAAQEQRGGSGAATRRAGDGEGRGGQAAAEREVTTRGQIVRELDAASRLAWQAIRRWKRGWRRQREAAAEAAGTTLAQQQAATEERRQREQRRLQAEQLEADVERYRLHYRCRERPVTKLLYCGFCF